MRTCTIEGCSNPHKGRGWCQKHYLRWWKHGDPLALPVIDDFARFWTKVDKTETCWLWRGTVNARGYGTINIGGKTTLAHRWSYRQFNGPIPEGLQLDHLCMVPLCVCPDHLEPVTNAENHRRAAAAKTHCIHGHEYTPESTYWRKDRPGHRQCWTCMDLQNQKRKRSARIPITTASAASP